MKGCKYLEFLESLYLGHEFEIAYKDKIYSIQRGEETFQDEYTPKDWLSVDVDKMFEEKGYYRPEE